MKKVIAIAAAVLASCAVSILKINYENTIKAIEEDDAAHNMDIREFWEEQS